MTHRATNESHHGCGPRRTAERVAGVWVVGLIAAGCAQATGSDPGDGFPTWEDYLQQLPTDGNGGYVVEGDMVFHSVEPLRKYYEHQRARAGPRDSVSKGAVGPENAGAVRSKLVVDQVLESGLPVANTYSHADRVDLSYCVQDPFVLFGVDHHDEVVAAMAQASKTWNKFLGAQFRYKDLADCTRWNDNMKFSVHPCTGEILDTTSCEYGDAGVNGFPADARSDRIVTLSNPMFDDSYLDYIGHTLEETLRHELGHVLGFLHEVPPSGYDDGLQCTGSDWLAHDDDGAGPLVLTEFDAMSIMRPCIGKPFEVTQLDWSASVSLYGLAPALIAAAVL